MALEPPLDPLDRALRAARGAEQQPTGWIELSESIMSRVRGLVTPTDPILVFPGTEPGTRETEGSTFVSARIVIAALRRLLQGTPTHAPKVIDLDIDDALLTGVELKLVASYGIDLITLAARIREQVLAEVADLIGRGLAADAVTIEIVDVTEGDPNLN